MYLQLRRQQGNRMNMVGKCKLFNKLKWMLSHNNNWKLKETMTELHHWKDQYIVYLQNKSPVVVTRMMTVCRHWLFINDYSRDHPGKKWSHLDTCTFCNVFSPFKWLLNPRLGRSSCSRWPYQVILLAKMVSKLVKHIARSQTSHQTAHVHMVCDQSWKFSAPRFSN